MTQQRSVVSLWTSDLTASGCIALHWCLYLERLADHRTKARSAMEGRTADSHLQEVMSPTHGPASRILNGISSTVDNSLPNQTGELARNGVQQATVMTSGPSTSAAVQMPSPLLPRDDRTGGDGTSGLVGSLGTTGAMYGSVSTTDVADASGVHGDVTAEAQGLGVATVQSGTARQITFPQEFLKVRLWSLEGAGCGSGRLV